MLRVFLLGGRWGPVPSPVFLALGGACLSAGVGVLLLTSGSTFAVVGTIEAAVFGLSGTVLLAVGGLRRKRGR